MYSVSLQGLADNFYDAKQLLPETFKKVCEDVNYPLNLRMHEVSTCHVVGGGSIGSSVVIVAVVVFLVVVLSAVGVVVDGSVVGVDVVVLVGVVVLSVVVVLVL